MAEKLRIGVLGLSHDHVWSNLQELVHSEHGEITAAADPYPELRDQLRGQFAVDAVFADYDELFERTELDAVYIFADNLHGAELAARAASQGLHVMTEKPLAATYADAARMVGAVRRAGVQLMCNWPIAWWPGVQHALNLVAEGRIGQVWQVNYRAAHIGPRELGCSPYFVEWLYDPQLNGAGAYMDYCCYGAALTCHLLGMPSRVSAMTSRLFKSDLAADDNAVLVMQHPRGLSTSTASWTQVGHMTSYEPMIYGTKGTLAVRNDGREVWLANDEMPSGASLAVPPPAAHMRNATEFFLHHLRSGTPIEGLCGGEVGLMTQEVLAAGLLAAAEERYVSLPLPVAMLQ